MSKKLEPEEINGKLYQPVENNDDFVSSCSKCAFKPESLCIWEVGEYSHECAMARCLAEDRNGKNIHFIEIAE